MSLAAQSHRPRVRPMSVAPFLLATLSPVPRAGQPLYLLVQNAAHFRQAQREQRPNQIHPSIHLQLFDLFPIHPRRLSQPPVLLALLHRLCHPSHQWPPSSEVPPIQRTPDY